MERIVRFHPAMQRVKEILDSNELGAIKSVEATMSLSKGFIGDDDIRFKLDLGGGAMMDAGGINLPPRLLSTHTDGIIDSLSSLIHPTCSLD